MNHNTIRDLRGVPFAQVEMELLRDPDISDALTRLYSVLLTYGPNGIFPGQETLAANTGASRETVNRRLRELRKLGLITWEQRPGSSNEYIILGYENYARQKAAEPAAPETAPEQEEGVIPGSQVGVTQGSHPSTLGVIQGSQGVCPPDHRGCDPGVTRSILNDLDPPNKKEVVLTAERLWSDALPELRPQMTQAAYDMWIRPCHVHRVQAAGEGEVTVVVACPNPYVVDWLRNRLHPVVERTLKGLVGQMVHVEYITAKGAA